MRTLRALSGLSALTMLAPLPVMGQGPSRTTQDGVYTAVQAERGAGIYSEICAACHGPQLGGIDAAPALTGGRFNSNWNGVLLSDMVDRIRVSMPQNDPGSLGRQQIVDVLAYILMRGGLPPGERELPRQTPFLRDIAFKSASPGDRPPR